MSEIKLTIDGTDYELKEEGCAYGYRTPQLYFAGKNYVGKAIQRDIPHSWNRFDDKKDNNCVILESFGAMVPLEENGNKTFQTIYKVKRLHDNEIFEVGDKTTHGTIEKFFEGWAGMEVHYTDGSGQRLSVVEKVKPKVPLFTTEDGVEIFKGDVYWFLAVKEDCIDMWKLRKCPSANSPQLDGYFKMFSTEEKAKEYILSNKPIQVSYKEIEQILLKDYCTEASFPLLKQLFKSKINT